MIGPATRASIALHRAALPDPMLSTLPNLLRRRDLIRQLTITELKSRQLESTLGWIWWLVDPLIMMLIYWGVVVGILGRGKERYAPYPVFILCALVTWKYFSSTVQQSTKILRQHEGLIKSIPFPTMALPISRVLSGSVFFICGFIVLLGTTFVVPNSQHTGARLPLLQVPVLMLAQMCIIAGAALAVSCLGVVVRDLQTTLSHVLRIGFYMSPGLYGADMVREKLIAALGPAQAETVFYLYLLNPFAILITGYRHAVFYGTYMPPAWWAALFVHSIAALTIGYLVFQHYDRRVIKFI